MCLKMRLLPTSFQGFIVLRKLVRTVSTTIADEAHQHPSLVLGLPYDCALDMWSIGCTLYELYTGKILFPGRTNNQMLLLMMELKGRFNSKMIKRAKFGDVHFEEGGLFISVEMDKITGKVLFA